jgi:hypothetical protein
MQGQVKIHKEDLVDTVVAVPVQLVIVETAELVGMPDQDRQPQ